MMLGPRTHHRACGCGWTGVYNTAGYADKALRGHDCGTDWTHRPCPLDHAPGSASHYQHCGCRCWPCRLAMLDGAAASNRARAYGRARLVPADPARAHVQRLIDAGMGLPRVAALSGIERSTLTRLVVGKTRRGRREHPRQVARATEAAILAVDYDPADGGASVDGGPTVRRLRSLVALGWYPALLAREAGWEQAHLDRILRAVPKHARIRPGTARHVHRLYQRLAAAPQPSGPWADRARRQARERGWQQPVLIGGRVLAGTPLEREDDVA